MKDESLELHTPGVIFDTISLTEMHLPHMEGSTDIKAISYGNILLGLKGLSIY